MMPVIDISKEDIKDATITTSTTKPTLLRMFSRGVVSLKDSIDDDDEGATWHSDDDDVASEGQTFRSLHHRAHTSLLKYKTQQDSLAHPYPKPYVCTTCNSDPQKKKSVRFTTVKIQSYPTILSDHPAPLSGPSVGLGWEVVEVETITVAQHFTSNPWRRQTKPKHFHLSASTRNRLLLSRGYSLHSLRRAEEEGRKIRESRQKNALGYPAWMHPMLSALGLSNANLKSINANTTKAVRPNNKKRSKRDAKKKTKQQGKLTQAQVREWLRTI